VSGEIREMREQRSIYRGRGRVVVTAPTQRREEPVIPTITKIPSGRGGNGILPLLLLFLSLPSLAFSSVMASKTEIHIISYYR